MSQEKLRKLHLIYGIVLSCIIIVTGICFIVSCVQIYNSGMRPFTRESIYTHFISIVVPVILCIVGIIGGMVLSLFPLEKQKIKGIIDTGVILRKFNSCAGCYGVAGNKARKERKIRKNSLCFCITVNVICILISLIYSLNKNNFPAKDINGEMVDAMLFILPCIIVGLGAIYATVLIYNASYARELQITKEAMVKSKNSKHFKATSARLTTANAIQTKKKIFLMCGEPVINDRVEIKNAPKKRIQGGQIAQNPRSEKSLLGIRLTLLVLAVTFIIIGIFNGGMADVLYKAINICTECIGLG